MNVIGISALYHDSACCVLKSGNLVAAVQEERFTRIKNDSSLPVNAFKYCLEAAGLTVRDIDCVAYYEIPELKLARQIYSGFDVRSAQFKDVLDPHRAEAMLRELFGYEGRIEFISHHMSHSASSYYFSGFEQSAILTVDGVGEWATTTYGYGENNHISITEEVKFPHSLGLFYATITSYLGFKVNSGEYKVMGLAPYGRPIYVDKLRQLITCKTKGQYELNLPYFDFISGNKMYNERLVELLGQPPRVPESDMLQYHMDVARSLQVVLEEVLIEKTRYLYEQTQSSNLCMAGGVGLNVVANNQILRDGRFTNLFVQPAANDAGGALGAAAAAYVKLTGDRPDRKQLEHVYLGPKYDRSDIKNLLSSSSIKFTDYAGNTDLLLWHTAEAIADGKVVGWFQGCMEFGPRALGARSILADPRVDTMRDTVNRMVKKRESFRPFAPAVLEEKAIEHFEIDRPSPFMLRTCQVNSNIHLPAITHVDNSARVQTVNEQTNPLFYKLIQVFESLTGCPMLLNTSFNVRGEPIVMSPVDALACFINTHIDWLVIGDCVVDRSQNSFIRLKSILNNLSSMVIKEESELYSFI